MELSSAPVGSPGLTMLSQLYGFAGNAAEFAVAHIDTLQQADSLLANRVGQVLAEANSGFGLGSQTALQLIGVGQALLGNPLTASGVSVATGNPIVMTCAAIGAIHYGWKALADSERELLLKTVSAAFEVGVEFIRSVTSFAYDLVQTLMSRENIEELKRMVAGAAEVFGRHLSEITKLLSDRLREGAQFIYSTAEGAASAAWAHVPAVSIPAALKQRPPSEDKVV
jgi:hypothetical protein